MWCERCKFGFISMMGRCYVESDSTAAPSEKCKNCEDCRQFQGNAAGENKYRCRKCKPGFAQHEGMYTSMLSSECHAVQHNQCTKSDNGILTGQFIGLNKVSNQDVCVENCPPGSYGNPQSGRCECQKGSHTRHVEGKAFCLCPSHATFNGQKCVCPEGQFLSHKGCQMDM